MALLAVVVLLRLRDRRQWDFPMARWGKRLRIEGDTLELDLREGVTERVSLGKNESVGGETVMARADFDGDGREDELVGRADRVGGYGSVRVRAAGGGTLLGPILAGGGEVPMRVVDVWVHPLGGSLPILIVGDVGGSGGQGLYAYRFDPKRQAMVRLAWEPEDHEWGFGRLVPSSERFVVAHRTYDYVAHMLYVAYTYRNGRLAEEARWYGPPPEELGYPSDPTFVFLAALMTVTLQLPDETPRYFTRDATARRFYQEFGAKAPGAYWNTVGEKGRLVREGTPVRFAVQATAPGGKGRPVTVQGLVAFVRRGNRWQIESITLAPP